MSALISASEAAALARPHIARAWFGRFDFPDGIVYWHNGVGTVTAEGHDWIGVTDPLSGRLVSISEVEEPRFGAAAAVTLTMSGVSKQFIRDVFTTSRQIEGRSATIYWAAFDAETQRMITRLIPLFPRGRMTAPKIRMRGIGERAASLTVENIWSSLNYAPGGKWNGADQRRRFPGDKGLDFVGVKVSENWQQ